ncbi:hypothetical protein NDU88_003952 [Pleurodeles waltl]|uniref:Uncharacterized protein n=1 Tax=Pleurodeles waltl TaxID=8319 RepID=A0AAV7M7S8_PLEWA|nr:hypothetical protein NDU88_003952 [Pleurodeles waltl]
MAPSTPLGGRRWSSTKMARPSVGAPGSPPAPPRGAVVEDFKLPLSERIFITLGMSMPLKAGFVAAILRRVADTSSASMFLMLVKNSMVALFVSCRDPSAPPGKPCGPGYSLQQDLRYWDSEVRLRQGAFWSKLEH